MRHRGCLITFEGLDGSGKTTQIKRLYESLKELGFAVVRTDEPYGTPIGCDIANLTVRVPYINMDPICELLLFEAARCENVRQNILPAIRNGEIIICDRFIDSTVAYQAYGRSIPLSTVNFINNTVIHEAFPDITVYIDIDPELSKNRVIDRYRLNKTKKDKFELLGKDFFEKVHQGYSDIIKDDPNRFIIIDGTKDIDTIASEILNEVLNRLSKTIVQKVE